MPAFWHWFIVLGTIAFVVWCVWIIHWSSKQGPSEKGDEELVGHVWDGDLEEWNKPAPKWWLYLYFLTVGWAVVYMIAYPGLGDYDGLLGWTQESQYKAEMQAAAARYEPLYEDLAAMEFDALVTNPEALSLGASLYASYCTTCHGSDARGATGYPNLTDDAWQWGSEPSQIVTTILNGRNAVMPALGSALGGEQGIDNMVRYVRSLSGLVEADDAVSAARPMFTALCSACHGTEGKGNPMLGAPDLTDDAWLYGSSTEAVRTSIVNGRNGMMPSHRSLLGENRAKILAAYVYSLSDTE